MDVQTRRHIYIAEDLLGGILLIAGTVLVVLLDLTRRRICALYQLAFALCAACVCFIIGGLIDHYLSDADLALALYSSYHSSSLTWSYIYVPILSGILLSIIFFYHLSVCNCNCCCLTTNTRATSHPQCMAGRIQENKSLYLGCVLCLHVVIGLRLNVRLRESAITPVGGTVHWKMIKSPFFLVMSHAGGLVLVGLKLLLQHIDRSQTKLALSGEDVSKQISTESAAIMDSVMRTSSKHASHRSQESVNGISRPSALSNVEKSSKQADISGATLPRKSAKQSATNLVTKQRRSFENSNIKADGDVSSLISSDSDSDDGVLQPNFQSSASTLPPRHSTAKTAAMSSRKGAVPRKHSGSSSIASGYSSSPPASPTHSSASGSSAFSITRSRPSNNSSHGVPLRQQRVSSNGSSSSTTFMSDIDDVFHSGSAPEYYSDRPTQRIRRRIPSTMDSSRRSTTELISSPSVSEWIECYDQGSGAAYYYNTRTGESRWKE